jgi:hypothetical protein
VEEEDEHGDEEERGHGKRSVSQDRERREKGENLGKTGYRFGGSSWM